MVMHYEAPEESIGLMLKVIENDALRGPEPGTTKLKLNVAVFENAQNLERYVRTN